MAKLTTFFITPTLFGAFSANGSLFQTQDQANAYKLEIHIKDLYNALKEFHTTITNPSIDWKANSVLNSSLRFSAFKNINAILQFIALNSSVNADHVEYIITIAPKLMAATTSDTIQKIIKETHAVCVEFLSYYSNILTRSSAAANAAFDAFLSA